MCQFTPIHVVEKDNKHYLTYFACKISAIRPDAAAVAADDAPKSPTQPVLLSMVICK